jgi:hypothetical protein
MSKVQINVWQCEPNPLMFVPEPGQPRRMVGTVTVDEADALNQAWVKTQNIEEHWNKRHPCRSCAVGDVYELNGEFHMVAGFGFEKIPAERLNARS